MTFFFFIIFFYACTNVFCFFLHAQQHCKVKLGPVAKEIFDKKKYSYVARSELYKDAQGHEKEPFTIAEVQELAQLTFQNEEVFKNDSVYHDAMTSLKRSAAVKQLSKKVEEHMDETAYHPKKIPVKKQKKRKQQQRTNFQILNLTFL